MNTRSSRAHSLLFLAIAQQAAGGERVETQLCLADLGGSEQVKKSGVSGELGIS